VAPYEASGQDAKSSAKGGQKRRKRRPKRITTKADYDDDNDKKIDGSDLGCVAPAAHSGKCQVRSPKEHFERFLEEDCSNHAYPIKHKLKDCSNHVYLSKYKLKDCDMINNFMTSGSLTPG
jgi:hypothetical protein